MCYQAAGKDSRRRPLPEQAANMADNSRAAKGGQMTRYGHWLAEHLFYAQEQAKLAAIQTAG